MKGVRTLIALAAALAGLVAYLYFVDAKKPVGDAEEKPKVFTVDADKITDLKIDTIGGGVAELKKQADGWQLVSPTRARADESEVSGITSNLSSMTVQSVVDENPADTSQYGLKEPPVTVAFKAGADKNYRTLELGSKTPTGSDMYARVGGEKKIFLVSGYLETTFNRKPFDLRDKKILTFDRDKVDRVEVQHGTDRIALAKAAGEWRMSAPVDARGDFGAVEGLISRVQSAQMKSIVNENAADLKEYGLEAPAAIVSMGIGSSRAGLAFGKKTPDGDVYVRDVSRPAVYTVGADLLTDMEKGATEYRRKGLFEFRAFNLDRLEITRDGTTTTIERLKGKGKDGADQWQNATTKKPLDTAKVETLLTQLSGLRAQAFAEPGAKTGLDAPLLAVKAVFDEARKAETARIAKVGADAFGGRPDEPGAAKLDAGQVDEVIKALDALK